MDEIKFSDLDAEAVNFILNVSNKRTEEEVLTESSIEEKIGGPIGAVHSLLDGIYVTSKMMRAITCNYEELKNALSKDEAEEMRQKMLSNAVQYTTAYKVVSEGIASEMTLYLNVDRDEPYTSADEIMADFDEDLSFITIHYAEGSESPQFYLQIIAFSNDRILIDSSRILEEEAGFIKYDYAKYLGRDK